MTNGVTMVTISGITGICGQGGGQVGESTAPIGGGKLGSAVPIL